MSSSSDNPSPGSMVSRFFDAAMACMDLMREQKRMPPMREITYSDFRQWVMTFVRRSTPGEIANAGELVQVTNKTVHDFLCVVLGSNYSAMTYDVVLGRVKKQTYAQRFRLIQGVDVRRGETDTRVYTLMHEILHNHPSVSSYAFLCTFFTSNTNARTQGRKNSKTFPTEPCSRFEQLLFTSTIFSLHQCRKTVKGNPKGDKRGSASKRQKLSFGSYAMPTSDPVGDSWSGNASQRVGWAVQRITQEWNRFSELLGFENVEEMCLPYIRMPSSSFFFEVIKTREEGFPPASQANSLDFDVTLSHDENDTFPGVCFRSDELDTKIRRLVDIFLKDIYRLTHSNELFTISGYTEWNPLASFRWSSEGLPPRFKQIITEEDQCIFEEEIRIRSPAARRSRATVPPEDARGPLQLQSEGNEEDSNSNAESDGPSSPKETGDSLEKFSKLMYSYQRTYLCSFEELVDTDNDVADGQTVEGNVQLLLTDPPYNVRRTRGSENSSHDVLTEDQMRAVVTQADRLLREGGHVVLFCTAQQFAKWYRYFGALKDEEGPIFTVDASPMVVTRHPSSMLSNPTRSSCTLQTSCELLLHAKKNGLPYADEARMVNYRAFNYVSSSYPGFKNVIDNVRGLLPGEQIRVPREPGHGTRALRPEQKPLSLLKELISRFSQPGDFVVDLFAGTFSTALACVQLPQARRFVGCEMDETCFVSARKVLSRNTAFAVVAGMSDIELSPEGMKMARQLDKTSSNEPVVDKRWCAPSGCPQFQRLPSHILAHLASEWENPDFVKRYVRVPVHRWPRKYRGRLEQLDSQTLLSIDATAAGLFVANSTIRHPKAGKGLFAAKTFHPNEVVCEGYGTLVYHDLASRTEVSKTYADGILGVTVERFKAQALQIHVENAGLEDKAERMNGRESVCVVPAPFCVFNYVNHAAYLEDDDDYKAWSLGMLDGKERKANCLAKKSKQDVNAVSELLPADLVILTATRVILPGEEILMPKPRGTIPFLD